MRVLLFTLLLLIGCGKDYSGTEIPFETNPTFPGDSGTNPGSRGSVAMGPTRFLTSTGGYIQSAASQEISITSGETFEGFASNNNGQWLLTKKYTSYSTNHWILRNINGGNATLQCSFLYSASLAGGLEVDGSKFYITMTPNYGTFGIRQFSLSSCADLGNMLAPISLYTSYNDYISFDGGHFYIPKVGNYGSVGETGLARLTPGSSATTIVSGFLVFGAEDLDWTGYRTYSTVRNGTYWASSYSYSNWSTPHTLWKVNGNSVIGIVEFALSDVYASLAKISVSPSGREIYMVTTAGGSVSIYTFDVSNF